MVMGKNDAAQKVNKFDVRSYGSKEFPLEIFLDHGDKIKGGKLNWHWHKAVEFVRIERGTVKCYLGSEIQTLIKGDLLFLNMNTIHKYDYSDDAVLEAIAFEPEFIAPEESQIYLKNVAPFILSGTKYIKMSMGTIAHEEITRAFLDAFDYEYALKDSDGYDMNVRYKGSFEVQPFFEFDKHVKICLLWKVFVQYHAESFSRGGKDKPYLYERLQMMLNFIHENYAASICLADVAESAGISKSESLRCFHEGLQDTPMNYVVNYRLSRAAHLFRTSQITITDVAMETGFDNSGYFCKAFKKKYEMTPREYRKKCR
jgi:AraC-like DNA-binding protein